MFFVGLVGGWGGVEDGLGEKVVHLLLIYVFLLLWDYVVGLRVGRGICF